MKFPGQDLQIIVIYRPPPSPLNSLTRGMFLDNFSLIIDSLIHLNDNFLLVGDFNIHVDSHDDNESRNFAQLLESADLIQHVHGQTHMSGHTLDLVITRAGSDLIEQIHVGPFLSDHAAVSFTCHLQKGSVSVKKVTYRKLRQIDHELFSENIRTSFHTLDMIGDVSQKARLYNTKAREILDVHAPEKCMTIPLRQHIPWYSESIRAYKRVVRRAERRWRASCCHDDGSIFVAKRNFLKSMIRGIHEFQSCLNVTLIQIDYSRPSRISLVSQRMLLYHLALVTWI